MPNAVADWPVDRRELRDVIRDQERLERRIELLQRSLDALRSDLIRVALGVGRGPMRDD
jgi:hypothetical protein